MTEYHDLRKADTIRIISYCKRSDARLKQQSSLSSYHTTLNAQFETIQGLEKHVKLINDQCNNVQQVIERYQKKVDEMYPKIRFRSTRKHCRRNEMENLFKRAHSPLCKVLAKLKKLRKKKNKVVNTLHNVDIEIQNLNHDPITNQQKKIIALNKQKKNQNKLQEIEEDIIDAEKKRNRKELIYIAEAREIFKQCEQLEKQRLNEIKQVLIDFNRAVHSSKYLKQLDSIYEQLISNIRTKQNSTAAVEYWAQAYGVNNVTITVSSETDEEENDYDSDSAIYYNIDSATDDDDDEFEDE